MNESMEELEVIPATRSPHGYLASPLSDNISEKDDGTLVVVGCPIARTGWQKYTVADLPQERAAQLGVDMSNPSATIDLYRPAAEVFHPEFLASLNGVTITDGHPPNGEFVDPKNFKKYSMGHIQNVRKGTEALEDGEWPIIADLLIMAEPLISKVRNKVAREISLGYDFSIDRDGDKIIQCSMLGNHNAVVPKGRAGDLIRIEDALPEVMEGAEVKVPEIEQTAPVEVVETIAYPPIMLTITKKEKQPVAEKKPSWFRSLMGKHLIEKARATDADPEKFMDEVEAMHEPEVLPVARAKARDDAEPPKDKEENEFKSDEDKKGKDEEEPMAEDRKKMHDALDAALDAKSKAKDSAKATDNFSALKKMLDEFSPEEKKEEEEQTEDAGDPAELAEILSEKKSEDCAACGMAHDDETECPGEEEVESGEEVMDAEEGESPDPDSDDDKEDVEDSAKATDRARATDAASRKRATDATMATLKALRPFAARSTDKAFQSTFNALLRTTKSSRTSVGDYGKFAGAARARDKAPRNPNPDRSRAADAASKVDPINKMQQFYDKAHKGGK